MDEEEKIEIENIGWGECVNSFVDVCKRWKEEEIGRLMKGWNIKGINEVDKEGKTCMMYLCERGLEIYAIKILERGDFRMIDNIDELGDDIMIKACKNGMEELVLMMLERVNRININRVNKSNKTGLMYAIEKVTVLDSPDKSDRYGQRTIVAFKSAFTAKALNSAFYRVIFSKTNYA